MNYIDKIGSQWYVLSKSGQRLSGGYGSQQQAEKRLEEIHYWSEENE